MSNSYHCVTYHKDGTEYNHHFTFKGDAEKAFNDLYNEGLNPIYSLRETGKDEFQMHNQNWFSSLICNIHLNDNIPFSAYTRLNDIRNNLITTYTNKKDQKRPVYKNFSNVEKANCAINFYLLFTTHIKKPLLHEQALSYLARSVVCCETCTITQNDLIENGDSENTAFAFIEAFKTFRQRINNSEQQIFNA
jgi:hypothetical protein